MMDAMEPRLAQLPEPIPPPSLAATVMARIAREPDPGGVHAPARVSPVTRIGRAGWVWCLVGLAMVVGVSVYGWLSTGAPPDITSARIGNGGIGLIPVEGAGVLVLAWGSWLYLVGLFAPLRTGREG